MNLITSHGFRADEEAWVKMLRSWSINHVSIVRMIESFDPNFSDDPALVSEHVNVLVDRNTIDEKEGADILQANQKLLETLSLLERFYISYSYYEIDKKQSKYVILSFFLKLLCEAKGDFVIDITRGERIIIPILFGVANVIPEKIKAILTLDVRSNEYSNYPFFFCPMDRDRRGSTTIKDILVSFLPQEVESFERIPHSMNQSSNDINNQVRSLNPIHLRNRISELSTVTKTLPNLLKGLDDSDDRRRKLYELTSDGLVTLFILYLREKYIEEGEKKAEAWFRKCDQIFSKMKFEGATIKKEIKYTK